MKQFRKTEDGLFICEECNKSFKLKHHLSRHIQNNHIFKKYFDTYIKDDKEGLCKNCGKENTLIGFKKGYKNVCSKKCRYEYNKIIYINKYGIHPLSNKLKEKQTKLQKYQNENYNNREKSSETCFKKYNVKTVFEYETVKNKIKNTKKEKYGNSGYNNRTKIEETNLERYGFKHTHQNKDILEKSQKTAFTLKRYKNTDIWYQGSYELDFLEKVYSKHPDVQRAPSIRYQFNRIKRVYHPDFYIPSLNLIIECKNSYLLNRDKNQIKAKEKATIANGFNYIMIVDKDYSIFNSFF